MVGSDEKQDWQLTWNYNLDTIAQSGRFDGLVLLCTNVSVERLSAGEVMMKYKEQVSVEQTFDFIKSPVQIRPLWLHSPQLLAGLTLLIMLAVLIATLVEHYVRQDMAKNKKMIKGLMPKGQDNLYPTAKKLFKAFQDYSIVVTRYPDGHHEVHYPKLRPVQRQILDILATLPPNPV